jgi:DNA-binding transcriptional MerR regulator
MAWSTSELAALASTTVNTVRHYHRVGLLPEPDRRYNGYKQYGARELVQLLRIRRLVDLGLPLARISRINGGGDDGRESLRELEAELVAATDRLLRVRENVAAILRDDAPVDSPAGFESLASRLSETDRAILHISGQFYDEQAMTDLRHMVEHDLEAGEVGRQIDELAADADEMTRERLARTLAPVLAQNLVDYPWLLNPSQHLSKSERVMRQTITEAMTELYNPAQLDVLGRATRLAYDMLPTDLEESKGERTRSETRMVRAAG